MANLKNWTKKEWEVFFVNNILIVIGSFILAFGTAIFQTRLNIVSGGVSGIAIIVQSYFTDPVIDIVVAILSAFCWIISLIIVGKEFAFRTLFSTILYPLFLTLCLRVDAFSKMAIDIAGDGSSGNVLLCAIFGGVFTGGGMALTFIGKGSTGGTDVFVILLGKITHLKESIWSFILDTLIIVLSMFLIKDNFVSSMCGIICAFVAALMIDYLFVGLNTSYQVDIISSNWEEISRFVQDDLSRGATLIPAKGGYKHTDKIILRVVLDRRQCDELKKHISEVDPKAFVTITKTTAVYGEGFTKHGKRKTKKKDGQ